MPGAEAEPRFRVVTDEACDIPDGMDMAPVRVPLNLAFGDEVFTSGELSPEAFFHRLETGPHHPTTSQPNPEQVAACYREAGDRPLLSLHLTGALSNTLNAAALACRMVAPQVVRLVDTRSVSVGQAFQVYAAEVAARRGLGIDEAMQWVGLTRRETRTLFALDTLEYLRRGGRIGTLQAALGGLLRVRPVIELDRDSGLFRALTRARSFSQAIEGIVRQILRSVPEGTPLRAAVGYGRDRADAEQLLERIREHYPLRWSGTVQITPVLAVHSGPRIAGVCFAAHGWPWER